MMNSSSYLFFEATTEERAELQRIDFLKQQAEIRRRLEAQHQQHVIDCINAFVEAKKCM
jgi:hypothetical protein